MKSSLEKKLPLGKIEFSYNFVYMYWTKQGQVHFFRYKILGSGEATYQMWGKLPKDEGWPGMHPKGHDIGWV